MNIHSRLISLVAVGVIAGALFGHGLLELSLAGKPEPSMEALSELIVAGALTIGLCLLLRQTERALPVAQAAVKAMARQWPRFSTNHAFQHQFDALTDGVTYFDTEDRLVYCNRSCRQLLWGGAEALTPGSGYADIMRFCQVHGVYAADCQPDSMCSERSTQLQQRSQATYEQHLADGRWLYVRERRDTNGGVLGIWTDITDLKQREECLRNHSAILDSMAESVLLIDPEMRMLDCNSAAGELFGRELAALRGCPLSQLFQPQTAKLLRETISPEVRLNGRWQGELCVSNAGGQEIVTEAVFVPLANDPLATRGRMIGVLRDIRERKAVESNLDHINNYDPLTSLPNRLLFRDRLDQILAHADWQRQRVSLHLIDLDNFKLINEGLGHVQGNQVLQSIAERLGSAVRQGDTLARIGGDQFALIQTTLHRVEQSAFRAQHMLDLIEPTLVLQSGRELNVTASIGIAVYPDDGAQAEDLVHNAGLALTRAKDEGRNTYRYFVRGMEEETRVRCALEHDMGRALAQNEFLFHYQPQVELATGRLIGCEALIRWRHPKYGLLYPNQFIPMAEESGAIIRLGEWGLREVCRQFKEWQAGKLQVGRIALNLSTLQFRYPEFASMVNEILQDSSIDPTCLELEVTESLAMENPELAGSIVAQLNRLGVKLAIDDFGTGYSSLSYLKRFPAEVLKVDRSLIDELATNPCDAAITIAVIELGHSLGMRVLAEGIETPDQLEFLRLHRCDFGQGTSFAAALPPEEFATYLKQHAADDH